MDPSFWNTNRELVCGVTGVSSWQIFFTEFNCKGGNRINGFVLSVISIRCVIWTNSNIPAPYSDVRVTGVKWGR